MSDDPQFSHISLHLTGTMTWYHNKCLSLTSVGCFPECLLLLCHFPVPFLAWHPLRLFLTHKTSQRQPKPTYFLNPAGLKTSRILAMVTKVTVEVPATVCRAKKFWAPFSAKDLVTARDANSHPVSLQCHSLPEESERNGRCWSGVDHKEILSKVHYNSENAVSITFLQVFL